MRQRAVYDGYSVKLPNTAGETEVVGDLCEYRTVARLIALGAFRYEDDDGPISVRLERKDRGSAEGYWVAYKRSNRKLHKTYVCEAHVLDPYNLDMAYKRLMHDVAVHHNRVHAVPP